MLGGKSIAAVATAATTAAVASATTAAAATWARAAFASFVDRDRPAVNLLAVQSLDGLVAGIVGLHLHETKAARTAGIAVGNDFSRAHRSMGAEQTLQSGRSRRPREITDVDLLRHHNILYAGQ